MNEDLRAVAIQSGAPKEVLNELWFNLFCVKFADRILSLAEQVTQEQPRRRPARKCVPRK